MPPDRDPSPRMTVRVRTPGASADSATRPRILSAGFLASRSDSGSGPFVLLVRHRNGVLVAEVVEVDAVRLPGRPGGDRRDDRDPERDAADYDGHGRRPRGGSHDREQGREECGD